ncbi:c-type cytochrome [Tropicibacter naphthalenivorans]|uniref:Putative bifunctional cbb3-type cytochrome c oxidase subunit II/cytochrome c n=1 Tax=Tropicibacter naphthalenivorans TaxID=441103 RepID=A0A0P1GGD3_9RHOB|nr:c-type cytochrome [Tropicibacter naphthalenivorans]CUH80634.1 putative bifunctional cbb3-type cytochrome c oxidase subunit II/cytochrome c [Tropicibacter naphthalenivorans]SMC89112.1 Cytochrome c [Tropicibacter naphthalenivorans]
MKKFAFAGAAVVAVSALAYLASPRTNAREAAPASGTDLVNVTLPDTLSAQAQMGKRAFDAVCVACHGTNAAGKDGFGPPLVHVIYEPNHHGDMSFYMAVQNGVQAHHWRFGNMPAQDGLTKGDVTTIIAYVRELQRTNGIN